MLQTKGGPSRSPAAGSADDDDRKPLRFPANLSLVLARLDAGFYDARARVVENTTDSKDRRPAGGVTECAEAWTRSVERPAVGAAGEAHDPQATFESVGPTGRVRADVCIHDLPLVEGGQGRTGVEVRSSAMVIFWLLVALALWVFAGLAALIW